MIARWSEITADEKKGFDRIRSAFGDQKIQLMNRHVSWKINMLLEIKTCEKFIELIGLSI